MPWLPDLAVKRLETVLFESILPSSSCDSVSGKIFQNTKLLQYVRHMNLLLHVLVILVQNSPSLAHLAAVRAVDLAVCHKNEPTTPLNVVTLPKDSPSFLPLQVRQALETLLLRIEHVFHHEHMIASELENCDDEEKDGIQGTI